MNPDAAVGLDALPVLASLVAKTMAFRESAYAPLAGNENLAALTLVVPFLAGASEMAGQSVTLVLNRVPRVRLIASLVVTGFAHILTALLWALFTTAIVSRLAFIEAPFLLASAVIALSFGPRLFAFLTIAPYYGEFLGRLLDGWMIACAAFGLHAALVLPSHLSIICAIAGWAVWLMLRNAGDRLLGPLIRRIERAVAGTAFELSPENVGEAIKRRMEEIGNGWAGDD